MSKGKIEPNAMAVEILHRAADEFDKAAAAMETKADVYRQVAGYFKKRDLLTGMSTLDQTAKLDKINGEHIEKSGDILKMLEVAHLEFFEWVREEDTRRMTQALSVEEARQTLAFHQMQCRSRENCVVHKFLELRVKQG